MARPTQEAIDTFVSITGCTPVVAAQRLEAHNGDLNEAINAHFSEGDRNIVQGAPTPDQNTDLMDVDEPLEAETHAPSSVFPGQPFLNSFSLLDPEFRNRIYDRRGLFNDTVGVGPTSVVSHPREVRQIPIEVRDGNESSTRSGHGPTIVDVTDAEGSQGPEIRGTVTLNDDDDDLVTVSDAHAHHRPSAPEFDAIPDDHNDIEEEMIRAAIEASKKEAELQELESVEPQQKQPQLEDAELAHAVSLSLKTAEQENSRRDHGLVPEDSGSSAHRLSEVGELGNAMESSARQGYGTSDKFVTGRHNKEIANSSAAQDEVEILDEQPLVRHRSRNTTAASRDLLQESGGNEAAVPVGSEDNVADQSPVNGNAFPSEEWGGISSEEHDEAVMLEAAMFGGIPEQGRYNFPYAPHLLARSGVDRTWQAPRPPSPGLVAQRLIREQQDDEYLASLQADREKELKALEDERAAKEAALEEERRKEEEARKKFEAEQELERLLAAKEASLPKEPAADDENAVTLLVRMPDGSRRGRRFLRSDKLQSLFDFIDIGRAVKPGSYRLVRPYPRQAFSDGESISTLNELGLMSKQEAFYLEPI